LAANSEKIQIFEHTVCKTMHNLLKNIISRFILQI